MSEKSSVTFERVFRDELTLIQNRREKAGFSATQSNQREAHDETESGSQPPGNAENSAEPDDGESLDCAERVGLAFSGGGIRSASFNLGFLQSLYSGGILRQVDYLSTVSGGGYAGSFLASMAVDENSQLNWEAQSSAPGQTPCTVNKTPSKEESDAKLLAQAGDSSEEPTKKELPQKEPSRPVKKSASPSSTKATLCSGPTGQQPPEIRRLLHSGNRMRMPIRFANQYLFGFLAFNLILFSGLACLAAAAAWAFRLLDDPGLEPYAMMRWLLALGFQDDVLRAFVPVVLFGLLWAGIGGIRLIIERLVAPGHKMNSWMRRIQRCLMLFMAACLLMGFTALLVTGDISIVSDNEQTQSILHDVTNALTLALIVFQILALLPVFGMDQLLRSGTNPRNSFDRVLFSLVGVSLWLGIPLFLFGVFVREDISETVAKPKVAQFAPLAHETPHLLNRVDLNTNENFWRIIRRAGNPTSENSSAWIPNWLGISEPVVNKVILKPAKEIYAKVVGDSAESEDMEEKLDRLLRLEEECRELQAKTWFYERIVPSVSEEIRGKLHERDKLRSEFLYELNKHCLSDPGFCRAFQEFSKFADDRKNLAGVVPLSEERIERIVNLSEQGRGLEARLSDQGWNPKDFLKQEWNFETFRKNKNKTKVDLSDEEALATLAQLREIQLLNRKLVQAYFGDLISPSTTVFATNTWESDQATRLHWIIVLLILFLLAGFLIPLNATSLHSYYRNRLNELWVTGDQRKSPLRFSQLLGPNSTRSKPQWPSGMPYLLVHATAHTMPSFLRREPKNPDLADSGRRRPFLLSALYCGAEDLEYAATEDYENSRFTFADALALSGSAVSPMMTNSFSLRVMLTLSNLRLGQWKKNPRRLNGPSFLDWFSGVAIPRISSFLFLNPHDRNRIFLSDGGHYENLGIESLLMRRTRVILAVDAGHDPEGQCVELLKIIRRNRAIRGVSIEDFWTESMFSDRELAKLKGEQTETHFVIARIRYPDPQQSAGNEQVDVSGRILDQEMETPVNEGWLIYIKPSFTGDEGAELLGYRDENPRFPYDPTTDQFYDQRQFESYRALGWHIGEKVVEHLRSSAGLDADDKTTWLSKWNPFGALRSDTEQLLANQGTLHSRHIPLLCETIRYAESGLRLRVARFVQETSNILSGPDNRPQRRMLLGALSDALRDEPDDETAEALLQAMACFEDEHDLLQELLKELDGHTLNDPVVNLRLAQLRQEVTTGQIPPSTEMPEANS